MWHIFCKKHFVCLFLTWWPLKWAATPRDAHILIGAAWQHYCCIHFGMRLITWQLQACVSMCVCVLCVLCGCWACVCVCVWLLCTLETRHTSLWLAAWKNKRARINWTIFSATFFCHFLDYYRLGGSLTFFPVATTRAALIKRRPVTGFACL